MSEDPSQRVKRIGSELRAYFAKKGFSQQDIADALNIHQTNVSELFLGKRPFGKNAAMKWHKAFGLSVNWLITGEGPMFETDSSITQHNVNGDNVVAQRITKSSTSDDFSLYPDDDLVPVLPQNLSLGPGKSIWEYLEEKKDSGELQKAPKVKQFPRYECNFRCITDAMHPEIYPGDMLGIRRHDKDAPLINGESYVIHAKPSKLLIRMLEKIEDGYILRAHNDRYQETFFPEDEIVGIYEIVGLIRIK